VTLAPSARRRIACHEAKLLAPLAERHANVFLKEPLNSPLARACRLQRALSVRRSLGSSTSSLATRCARGSEGFGSCNGTTRIAFQLMDDHVDQVALPSDGLVQGGQSAKRGG